MSTLQEPRQATLTIIYEGADISRDIAPFLLSFEYTDKSSGECDDLQITLEDRDGLWRDPWFPSKGERISATIVTKNWNSPGESMSLYCGSFEIDEIEISEPPMTVSIKAVAAPRSTAIRDELKNKNWEGFKLSGIAGDIAGKAGLTSEFFSSKDPMYDTRNQAGQSDINFLMKLCSDAGLALKVTDSKIVIFDEAEYEGQPSVAAISKAGGRIINMSIRTKFEGTYKAAKVSYSDTEADTTHTSTVDDESMDDNGQVLRINQRVKSEAEAEELAKNRLHQSNKKETTGSFTLIGDTGLAAGSNVDISGYGKFDGTYFIESAKHSLGNGYTTAIDIREGAPSKKSKSGKKKKGNEKPQPQRGKVGEFDVYE